MAFESLLHDVRLALRGLVREPGYSLVAILILAIGIGANTAVFSVVNPLVLKPLPFRDADRLVWIANTGRGEGLSGKTYRVAAYEELARNNRSFESLTAYFAFFGYISYTMTGSGEPERLVGVQIAPGFLEQLGIRPQLGRGFAGDEWKSNGPGATLHHRRTLAAPIRRRPRHRRQVGDHQRDAVRRHRRAAGRTSTSASTFTPGTRVDMLVPARLEEMRNWGNTLAIIGRLKPGVTVEQARAEFATLVPPIEKALDYRFGTAMSSLKTHVSGPMRRALMVLWAAVGLVLLIVCANLSNLLLARTASRAKEFAVRMALGSSRGRIVSQLMVEGVVLAVCGAVIGVPLAYVLTGALKSSATLAVPLLHQVHVDGTALAITALTAIVSGIAVGAVPALRVAARPPQDALKAQGRGTTDGRHHARVRSTLVVVEVALASVLLVGAGLLLRSFVHILDVDLGFQPSRAMAVRLEVSSQLDDNARRARLFAAARRAAELPGVEATGLTDALPLDRNRTWDVGGAGADVSRRSVSARVRLHHRARAISGRWAFRWSRGATSPSTTRPTSAAVGIVNESLAKAALSGPRSDRPARADRQHQVHDRRRRRGRAAEQPGRDAGDADVSAVRSRRRRVVGSHRALDAAGFLAGGVTALGAERGGPDDVGAGSATADGPGGPGGVAEKVPAVAADGVCRRRAAAGESGHLRRDLVRRRAAGAGDRRADGAWRHGRQRPAGRCCARRCDWPSPASPSVWSRRWPWRG